MEKITGTVERTSDKFSGGICINGTWYNGTSKTALYVKKVEVGSDVEIDVEDKKIQFLKVTGKSKSVSEPMQQKNEFYTKREDDEKFKQQLIVCQNCRGGTIQMVEWLIPNISDLPKKKVEDFKTAKDFQDFAEILLSLNKIVSAVTEQAVLDLNRISNKMVTKDFKNEHLEVQEELVG